ncbi:hypothetical protein DH2020_036877 [Rehmannia glutinosa]|uniref:Uncharacterized protein n=1 Tax=Rehmannia glutinosa TaxID=99300 RepID=A0ABR0V4X2_REHGL
MDVELGKLRASGDPAKTAKMQEILGHFTEDQMSRNFAARVVMAERRDTGAIRPCYMREAYRRLKLEGKIPKGSMPRLFR